MDGDGAGIERRRVAPDPAHDLFAGENAPRVAGDEPEEVELARSQPQRRAVLRHLARRRVDDESVEGESLLRDRLRLGTPEHGADAGRELARGERLRDVVVGAELEPDDAVGLLTAGGE